MTDPNMRDRTVAYKSRLWAQVRNPTNVGEEVKIFEDAVRPPGVRVFAIDYSSRSVFLTREYRRELGDWGWRVPGGKVFDYIDDYLPIYWDLDAPSNALKLHNEVLVAADREAREEAGLVLRDCELIGKSVAGSSVHWDLYFVQGAISAVGENEPEPGELISMTRKTGWQEAIDMIDSGEMSDDRSAIWLRRAISALLTRSNK